MIFPHEPQIILAASKNSTEFAICALVFIGGGAVLYLIAVFSERNTLRTQNQNNREQLAHANRELTALRAAASQAKAITETRLTQERAEVQRQATRLTQERAEVQRQANDAIHANARQIAAKERELQQRDADLAKKVDELARTTSKQLADQEELLRKERAKIQTEAAEKAKAQERAFAAKEEEILAAMIAVDAKVSEAKLIHAEWVAEIRALQGKLEGIHGAFEQGFLKGRHWLSRAYADLLRHHDEQHEWALALTAQPDTKVAAELTEVKRQRRELLQQVKFLRWQLESYEEYFPILADYRDAILDEAIDLRLQAGADLEAADPALAKGFLSKQEFESLGRVEKFQLALERYHSRPKSAWEIGRDYERQIGYQYEVSGWRVEYHGALQGLEDLGRDLICQRGQEVVIIQCKCWKEDREIRERHVFQLYGTSVLRRLEIENQGFNVKPLFITTGRLSEVAAKAAKALGVEVFKIARCDYPLIKCNVNAATRERIYHLPFDQQYDRIVIGDQPGEKYVSTVAEAERLGFRRAFRWTGES